MCVYVYVCACMCVCAQERCEEGRGKMQVFVGDESPQVQKRTRASTPQVPSSANLQHLRSLPGTRTRQHHCERWDIAALLCPGEWPRFTARHRDSVQARSDPGTWQGCLLSCSDRHLLPGVASQKSLYCPQQFACELGTWAKRKVAPSSLIIVQEQAGRGTAISMNCVCSKERH